ncbi:unnamed protein product [Spirodela intermedia]|uniref:Uncharacterized protein n=1 Tax=Spirodela intermedia TaxID=51605 RepID=A0A7I8JWM9_SPIIN|nr:unnamed protein product [Spirodela intermedia]
MLYLYYFFGVNIYFLFSPSRFHFPFFYSPNMCI